MEEERLPGQPRRVPAWLRAKSSLVDDEDLTTETTSAQEEVERTLERTVRYAHDFPNARASTTLRVAAHIDYLLGAFEGVSSAYECLDASKPWLCYWVANGLGLMHYDLTPGEAQQVVSYLGHCQHANGGFCGGPQQDPHLAPTYASVMALMSIQTEEAYALPRRAAMHDFLMRMKQPDGSFSMHQDGEADVRATYCALSVANALNILTPELTNGTAEYVRRCQTWEGGIGGAPFNEAHGGYTFCGVACAVILKSFHVLNEDALLTWLYQRQMPLSGGFQGRCNKLVDGCYSFWVGACFALLSTYGAPRFRRSYGSPDTAFMAQRAAAEAAKAALARTAGKHGDVASDVTPTSGAAAKARITVIEDEEDKEYGEYEGEYAFAQIALQEYLLLCCQGRCGLLDKPTKYPDLYHTCYGLNGLSVAQHNASDRTSVFGKKQNLLRRTDPLYGVVKEKADAATAWWGARPYRSE